MKKPDQPFKILVVDDEPDLKPLIKQRMRRQIRHGMYTFVFAQNGVEAVKVLREDKSIDMVLSDINMPQMDGLTLLAQLPEIDPNLRAVIISAYGDMSNIRTAMNRGAFDFVTKPVDFTDLRVTIERTLEHLAKWRAALASRDQLVAIKSELNIAGETQQSILPTSFPKTGTYEIHANMVPAREVGGDMYDILPMPGGQVFATVADVSGKGVPAALLMMSTRTALKGSIIGCGDLAVTLAEANNLICQDSPDEMFVTVITIIYDPNTGICCYAGAGHHSPVLIGADGNAKELPMSGGLAVGLAPGFPYDNHEVTLNPGESLLLYTDGVTEAMTEEREEFGLERLLSIFEGAPPTSAEATTKRVFDAVNEFAGDAAQSDDITCLCLHRHSPSPQTRQWTQMTNGPERTTGRVWAPGPVRAPRSTARRAAPAEHGGQAKPP